MQFALFFSNDLGAGIQPIDAMDAAHAMDIAHAEHPGARLAVVPAETIEGLDRHRLLAGWLEEI